MDNRFVKDTEAVLDYLWDWKDWLAVGETIASAVVTTTDGLTIDSYSNLTTGVTAWISGGTDANTYLVTCHIVTSLGRTEERFIIIACVDYR